MLDDVEPRVGKIISAVTSVILWLASSQRYLINAYDSMGRSGNGTYVTTAVLAGCVDTCVRVCCGRVLVAVMLAVEPCTLVKVITAVLAGWVEIVSWVVVIC